MKFQAKSVLISMALLGTFMTTWWMPDAAAQSCQPLTIASLPSYLPAPFTGFVLDDEGFASSGPASSAPPLLFLNNLEVTNPATGAFTGYIGPLDNPLEYPANGTLTQIGTSGLSITFGYALSPVVEATRYSYTGAIAVEKGTYQACALFMAGTYTESGYLLTMRGFGGFVTSGPYPFSGQWAYEGPN